MDIYLMQDGGRTADNVIVEAKEIARAAGFRIKDIGEVHLLPITGGISLQVYHVDGRIIGSRGL